MTSRRSRILTALTALLWVVALVLALAYLLEVWPYRSSSALSPSPSTEEGDHEPPGSATIARDGSGFGGNGDLAPTPSTTAATTPPAQLTVSAGGDVIGDRGVGAFLDRHGGAAVFRHVAPFFTDADVAFVNLESPASDKGKRNPAKDVTFRGRPALVDGLQASSIDVVSLANNHALDWGSAALLDTMARLNAKGIAHAGAGSSIEEATQPAFLQTGAGRVAVLAYTNIVPAGFLAGKTRAGIASGRHDVEQVLRNIARVDKEADWLIVSFHWGKEYKESANEEQRTLAHRAVEAGADLVLGHHPHVIQGLECYRDRLIAYSLGDFVFDHYSRVTGEAFILRVTLDPAGPPALEALPVYLDEDTGVPRPVQGDAAGRILSRLARLSADLGLKLNVAGDRAYYGQLPSGGG